MPPEATVVGGNFRTSLWEAAFLNAFSAHAGELEDDSFNTEGGSSWDIGVIPPLLSLVQGLRLSGKTLMEALVVGLEVHVRTCLSPTTQIGYGVFPAAIGPAVGAARVLGLNKEQTMSAIGLALSTVPLSMINLGTDAHFYESAFQSLHGLVSAEMAKEGMSSNPDIVTYLTRLLGEEKVHPEKMIEGLGTKWLLETIWIKKYPCCWVQHRQLDIFFELRKQYGFSYEDVDTIEVHTSPFDEILNRPDPKTEGDLQFSFYHTLGTALLDGDVNLKHFNRNIIADPRYKESRSKVKVILHSDRSNVLMEAPAELVIRTRDGRTFSGRRQYPIGSPKEPLTTEQVKGLYGKFTAGFLSPEKIRKTVEAISNLENLDNIEGLMDDVGRIQG